MRLILCFCARLIFGLISLHRIRKSVQPELIARLTGLTEIRNFEIQISKIPIGWLPLARELMQTMCGPHIAPLDFRALFLKAILTTGPIWRVWERANLLLFGFGARQLIRWRGLAGLNVEWSISRILLPRASCAANSACANILCQKCETLFAQNSAQDKITWFCTIQAENSTCETGLVSASVLSFWPMFRLWPPQRKSLITV